jgi:hypothetical protein
VNNLDENANPSKQVRLRVALRGHIGKRSRYTGTFERDGYKRSYRGPLPTVLFKNITDASGVLVADHIWMDKTKALAEALLNPGDKIAFDAQVEEYTRGYFGHRDSVWVPASIDYRLSWLTQVEVVVRADSAARGIEVA